MLDVPKSEQELRFRNVTLHSQGRKEHGTLYLFRHHLLFSFLPEAGHVSEARNVGSQHQPTASRESSTLTEASTVSAESSVSGGTASSGPNALPNIAEPSREKPRPKEIWIPYPMVSYCVLRPSHLQGQTPRPREDDDQQSSGQEGNDLFPPVFGTAFDGRASTDSPRLAPYSSPQRPSTPSIHPAAEAIVAGDSGRQPAIRMRRKDLQMMALHFHPSSTGRSADEIARQAFYVLRDRCCIDRIEDLHAFHYRPPKHEVQCSMLPYNARREYARMGIGGKAADGPGTAWRISDINREFEYSATYPRILCVPRSVSDNLLKYGGTFRSRSRIPCLTYLHTNGGSITRSSQPLVGVQNKRNPQDERLVSAIFSSHTPLSQSPDDSPTQAPSLASPSTTTVDSGPPDPVAGEDDIPPLPLAQSDTAMQEEISEKAPALRKKIYGSTRRNLIVDARPKINALANRATGGGIEDVGNYTVSGGMPIEKVFLNIPNIHVMRASLEKVFESFANSDYIKMKPDQEALRKSGWLGHIANMLDGAEMVARVVGLGGSHVLIHCSDGWDRTAQVAAMAQVMLDPHYRTLEGFITLVQKDFLSFGHKFKDRNGIEGSEKWFEIENERIQPSRARENGGTDQSSLNALGAKAFTGAKNWFEKNRGNLFKQQNSSKDSLAEQSSSSRPASPPPNALLHSPPTAKDEKQHRMSEKEVSPIFHQFLDTVYQLQRHFPDAFEFNERFLRRLFYHTYACQYGEFLFNCDKERSHYIDKLPSVWAHFSSKRAEFVNPSYVAKIEDTLLFPKRQGLDREVEVRWWNELFGRKDEEMNVPRTTVLSDQLSAPATAAPTVSVDDSMLGEGQNDSQSSIKESRSTPSLSSTINSMATSLQGFTMQRPGASNTASTLTDDDPTGVQERTEGPEAVTANTAPRKVILDSFEYDDDPLGATASKPAQSDRLDFAAFASQNAFSER